MTKHALKTISDAMDSLGLEYGFMTYDADPVVYPYFVGEYAETEGNTEDGFQASTFMLSGFHRGTWLELETAKQRIEDYFRLDGTVYMSESGSACAIIYANALVVPTEDAELKRIQINLSIKEWKVN